MKKRKVIDADNQVIIEYFNESNTKEMLDKYENDGRWEDVGVDCDGDIILWTEL